jgi:hypothetical protein
MDGLRGSGIEIRSGTCTFIYSKIGDDRKIELLGFMHYTFFNAAFKAFVPS